MATGVEECRAAGDLGLPSDGFGCDGRMKSPAESGAQCLADAEVRAPSAMPVSA